MKKLLVTLCALLALTVTAFGLASCMGNKPGKESDNTPQTSESAHSGDSTSTPDESTSDSEVTPTTYTITWMNGEEVLGTDEVEEGETPEYTGATPTKAADAEYTYTFAGWDPEVAPATEDATYTATFDGEKNSYTITWMNGEEVLDTEEYEYGETPEYTGEEPTKAADAQYTYTFNGWTPEVTAVTGDATYTATFDAITNFYTITWKNGEEVLDTEEYVYGETPAYEGEDPTKDADAGYTNTFTGWTPEVTAVTGDATYTATFELSANTDTAYAVKHHFATVADPADENDYVVKTVEAQGTTDTTTSVSAYDYYNHTAEEFEQKNIAGDGSTVIDIYYNIIDASKLSLYLIDTSTLAVTGGTVAIGDAGDLVVSVPSGTADATIKLPLPASWEDPLKNYAEIKTKATTYTSAAPEYWNCQWVGYTDGGKSFTNTAGEYVTISAITSTHNELPACVVEEEGNLYLRVYAHYHTGIWLGMTFSFSEVTIGEPIDPNRTTLNFNVDTATATNYSYFDHTSDTIVITNGAENDYWNIAVVTISLPDFWEAELKAGAAITAQIQANRSDEWNTVMTYFTNDGDNCFSYLNYANSYVTLTGVTTEAGTLPACVTKEDDKLYLKISCRYHHGLYGANAITYTIKNISIDWKLKVSYNTGTLQWGWGDYDTYYGYSGSVLSTGSVRTDGSTPQYGYYKYAIGRNQLTFKLANTNFDVANSLLRIKIEYNDTVYSYDQENKVWKNGSGKVNDNIKMYNEAGNEINDLSAYAVESGTSEYVTFVVTGITKGMAVKYANSSALVDDVAGLKIISNPPLATHQGGADSYVCLKDGPAYWGKVDIPERLVIDFDDEVETAKSGTIFVMSREDCASGYYVPNETDHGYYPYLEWWLVGPSGDGKCLRIGLHSGSGTVKIKLNSTQLELLATSHKITFSANAARADTDATTVSVGGTSVDANWGNANETWTTVTMTGVSADEDGYISIDLNAGGDGVYVWIDNVEVKE